MRSLWYFTTEHRFRCWSDWNDEAFRFVLLSATVNGQLVTSSLPRYVIVSICRINILKYIARLSRERNELWEIQFSVFILSFAYTRFMWLAFFPSNGFCKINLLMHSSLNACIHLVDFSSVMYWARSVRRTYQSFDAELAMKHIDWFKVLSVYKCKILRYSALNEQILLKLLFNIQAAQALQAFYVNSAITAMQLNRRSQV